jgi:ABC-type sugar transport system ATPase subunit
LIDGELDSRGGVTCFKAGDAFSIPLRGDLVAPAEKVAVKENGKVRVRLGIRSEDIRVGRDRIGVNSFELPVYAVVREVETSVISFDLESGFLYARVKEGESGEYRLSETVWLDFDPDRMFFYVKTVEIVKG